MDYNYNLRLGLRLEDNYLDTFFCDIISTSLLNKDILIVSNGDDDEY